MKKIVWRMPIKEKANLLENNAVTGAWMCEYRVKCFFWDYILIEDYTVGKVTDNATKMEFQDRGWHHTHCLLWEDGTHCIHIDWDEGLCAFIDKMAPWSCIFTCMEAEDDEQHDEILKNACEVPGCMYDMVDNISEECAMANVLEKCA